MRCTVDDASCSTGRLKRGLCERHYRRMLHTGTVTGPPPLLELHDYYTTGPDCWVWTGAVWSNAYGKAPARFESTLAHRAVWISLVGQLSKTDELDHLCHNADPGCPGGTACRHRLCVNPSHLQIAARGVNLRRARRRTDLCRNELHDLSDPELVRYLPDGNRVCIPCVQAKNVRSGRARAARKAAAISL